MADISFDQVFEAARQLPPDQQDELIRLLQAARQTPLSAGDKQSMFESMILEMDSWPENWSLNREDWYDDNSL